MNRFSSLFAKPQKEAGLAVYHRHYLECIWPATVPRPRDVAAPVRAFAARDDYEPMTFTLFPLRDLRGVDVDVTDLRNRAGRILSREDISVRFVRYMHVRPNYTVRGIYYRAPDVLMPMRPSTLRKHENFRVWLTVRVGPFAPEGLYRGEARVRAGSKLLGTVPLTLRVLPFVLEKDRSLVYGQYYRHPYASMASGALGLASTSQGAIAQVVPLGHEAPFPGQDVAASQCRYGARALMHSSGGRLSASRTPRSGCGPRLVRPAWA